MATSFFGLYVIGTFQYFLPVVLDAGNLGEFRVQFIAFGVGDDEIDPVDFREPVAEEMGTYRQVAHVRGPGKRHFHARLLLSFGHRGEVGK